jgi:hypothetical protein
VKHALAMIAFAGEDAAWLDAGWVRPAAGGLAVLVVAWAVAMNSVLGFDRKVNGKEAALPHGVKRAVLGMQLSRDGGDLRQVLCPGDAERNRRAIRRHVHLDFPFMFLYWLLFLAFSAVLAREPRWWAPWVACAAALTGTLTLVSDVLEDRAMLRATEVEPEQLDRAYAARIHRPSLVKWGFLYVTLLFFGIILAPRLFEGPWSNGRTAALAVLCLLFQLAGALGLGGLFRHKALEWATAPMALGIVLSAVLLLLGW